MIAYAFHNRNSSGIAHTKTFSGNAVNKCFSAGSAIQGNITDDNIFILLEVAAFRRIYHQFSAGKTLTEIVIGIAFQFQR